MQYAAIRRATPEGIRHLDITDNSVAPPTLLSLLIRGEPSEPAAADPGCTDCPPAAVAGVDGTGGVAARPKRTPSVGPLESVSQNRLRVSGTGGGGDDDAAPSPTKPGRSLTPACGLVSLLGACSEPWQVEDAEAILAGCPKLTARSALPPPLLLVSVGVWEPCQPQQSHVFTHFAAPPCTPQVFEADVVAYAPARPLLAVLHHRAFRARSVMLCDDPHSRRPLGPGVVDAVCAALSGTGDAGSSEGGNSRSSGPKAGAVAGGDLAERRRRGSGELNTYRGLRVPSPPFLPSRLSPFCTWQAAQRPPWCQ